MKTLTQYLAESAKEYEFRLKTIVELTDEQIDKLETHLRKYDAFDVAAPKKTILQSAPLDFYNTGAREVYIIDFKTRLPVVPQILVNEMIQTLGISEHDIRVRGVNEPGEILDQANMEEKEVVAADPENAVLNDPDYSEVENADHKDAFGNEHTTKLLDELEKTRTPVQTEYKGS